MPEDAELDIWADLIAVCLKHQALISFYTSRDGGAFCVQVRHDDYETLKLWPKDQGELNDLLQDLRDAFSADG